MKRRAVKNGFTLVELLVVVAVIGVLSGVVLVSMDAGGYFKRGRDSRRLAELGQIQTALELDFADLNQYAPGLADLATRFLTIPTTDPDGATPYGYCPDTSDYMSYEVCATMESTPLPDACRTPALGCTENCCLTNPF